MTPFVDQDIRADEGFRASAYPDPDTHAEPWTIGYGCTGQGIAQGTVWTLAYAVQQQVTRRGQCEVQLDSALSWWRELNDARQDVLVNWTYNQGIGHVLGFHNALGDMSRDDWIDAASQMLASLWAKEVGGRATRLAAQMRLGVRIAPGSAIPPPAQIPSIDPIAATKAAIGE